MSRAPNMAFSHSKPVRRTNEDVFFAYYPRLLEWAAQITRNDRAEAEDLVHDFYLRVSRISKSIDGMEQMEHYLFKVLRNLYYSRLRRAGRVGLDSLSIVDFDSVEQGLAAVDRRGLFLVRSHLRQICRHACQRKSTARSASILILRFFHGYYPIEVMKILQASRFAVDRSLQVARNEARLFLERPDVLRSIQPGTQPAIAFSMKGEDTQQLFLELQEAIFSATEGQCFDPQLLEKRYNEENELSAMTTQELSHLVSCRLCLDRVNTILHLPLLAERSPEDGIDRDNSSVSGGEGGSGVTGMSARKTPKKGPSVRRMERRARALFEHRPNSLEIVVDGDVRAAHKVSAETNELRVKLTRKEEPSFIEVFSEQGFCLAYLQIDDPASSDRLEQTEAVSLSDNRSLTVSIDFASDVPVIHVLYVDPVFAQGTADFDEEPQSTSPRQSDRSSPNAPLVEAAHRPEKWIRRQISALWEWIRLRYEAFLSRMNPLLATAIICATASIVLFVLFFHASAFMKPEDLLRRSTTAENAPIQSGATGVIVQAVRIQTPRGNVARTLYRDMQGRRQLKEQKLSREDAAIRAQLEGIGVLWNDPLSADSFRDWHDRAAVERDVVKRSGNGLLTLTTTIAEGQIVSESLTVRESDFHPVERTVELRDTGTVEIAELNYSVLPWSSVNPDLFEPVSDSLPSTVGPSIHPALLPHLPRALSPTEIDSAELGARLVLNRMHLDTNDRIELVRQSNGVRVAGVVESDAEKHQLQAQLYVLPHISTDILTVREMAEQPNGASAITSIQESSAATTPTPSALERYFTERGMNRIAAGTSVQDFVVASFAVKRQSEQIAELLSRFASNSTLSPAARASLSELLTQHKAALLSALEREDRQLVTLHLIPHSTAAGEIGQGSASALNAAAERNFALCAELTSEGNASQTSAQEIAPQLADSIAQLRAVVLRISATAQMYSPSPDSPQTANQNR